MENDPKGSNLDAPLRTPTESDLRALAATLCHETSLPLVSSGWMGPIDWDLKSDPALSQSAIDRRVAELTARWADVYIGEIDRQLARLESFRSSYQDIADRATQLLIAQHELDKSEQIHELEVKDGWFSFQEEITRHEQRAAEAWRDATLAAESEMSAAMQDVGQWSRGRSHYYLHFRAALATSALFPTYSKVHKDNAPKNQPSSDYMEMSDAAMSAPSSPPYIRPGGGGKDQGDAFPYRIYHTFKQAYGSEVGFAVGSIWSQRKLSVGAKNAADFAEKGRLRAWKWHAADAEFRRRRTELAIEVNRLRKHAQQNGPMNYEDRMRELRSTFVAELSAAYAKARVATQGLADLWGVAGAPEVPDVRQWDDSSGSFFSALLSWYRDTQREVAKSIVREGSNVLIVSVKTRVGPNLWRDAIDRAVQSNHSTVSFYFTLPESVISLQSPRVRGLTAHVVGAEDRVFGTWAGVLRPPLRALAHHRNGSRAVHQDCGNVDLGRIQSREFPRAPDVIGLSSLRNAAPVSDTSAPNNDGDWRIELNRTSSRGVELSQITDVELDIFLAGSVKS